MDQAQLAIETQKLARLQTSHILHLILSLISVGIWIPIWILVAVSNGLERAKVESKIRKLGS